MRDGIIITHRGCYYEEMWIMNIIEHNILNGRVVLNFDLRGCQEDWLITNYLVYYHLGFKNCVHVDKILKPTEQQSIIDSCFKN